MDCSVCLQILGAEGSSDEPHLWKVYELFVDRFLALCNCFRLFRIRGCGLGMTRLRCRPFVFCRTCSKSYTITLKQSIAAMEVVDRPVSMPVQRTWTIRPLSRLNSVAITFYYKILTNACKTIPGYTLVLRPPATASGKHAFDGYDGDHQFCRRIVCRRFSVSDQSALCQVSWFSEKWTFGGKK